MSRYVLEAERGLFWSQEVLVIRTNKKPVGAQGRVLIYVLAHRPTNNHLVKMLPSDLTFGAWVWWLASVTDMVVFHLEPEFKSQPLSGEQLRVDACSCALPGLSLPGAVGIVELLWLLWS